MGADKGQSQLCCRGQRRGEESEIEGEVEWKKELGVRCSCREFSLTSKGEAWLSSYVAPQPEMGVSFMHVTQEWRGDVRAEFGFYLEC